jgi:hypothetical protein
VYTTYHAGQNIVWACWMRIAFALSADPAVLRQALEAGARSAAGFVDDMVAALSGQLRRERADLARGSHARRFEMVSLSRAGAAGCPPDRPSSWRPALPSRLDSCRDVAQRQPRFRLIRPGHAIKRAQQASRGLSPEAPRQPDRLLPARSRTPELPLWRRRPGDPALLVANAEARPRRTLPPGRACPHPSGSGGEPVFLHRRDQTPTRRPVDHAHARLG